MPRRPDRLSVIDRISIKRTTYPAGEIAAGGTVPPAKEQRRPSTRVPGRDSEVTVARPAAGKYHDYVLNGSIANNLLVRLESQRSKSLGFSHGPESAQGPALRPCIGERCQWFSGCPEPELGRSGPTEFICRLGINMKHLRACGCFSGEGPG